MKIIILCMFASLLTACSIFPHHFTVPSQHVMMFDEDGRSLNPAGKCGGDTHSDMFFYPNESDGAFRQHSHKILTELKTHQPKKILLFIHGGLTQPLCTESA